MDETEVTEKKHGKKNNNPLFGNIKFAFSGIFSNGIRSNVQRAIPFWIASLLTGLIAVGYTKAFAYSESILQYILHWHSWFNFIMTPVCFVLAWLIVQIFAPNARGAAYRR